MSPLEERAHNIMGWAGSQDRKLWHRQFEGVLGALKATRREAIMEAIQYIEMWGHGYDNERDRKAAYQIADAVRRAWQGETLGEDKGHTGGDV